MKPIAVCLGLAACLPVREIVKNNDQVTSTYVVNAAMKPPTLQAVADSTDVRLSIDLTRVSACTREERQRVRRWQERIRTTNKWVHVPLYLVAFAAAGLGGAILYDNISTDHPEGRTFPIGNSLDEGQAVGGGVSAVGTTLLLIALGSTASAADEKTYVGHVEKVVKAEPRDACETTPAANTQVGLVLTVGGTRSYLRLGSTDAGGHLEASWATIGAQLPPNARPEASIVAGTAETAGETLATVVVPRTGDPDQAWASASAKDTPDAYREFRARYPDSPNVAEATRRERAAEVAQEVEAALAAGDPDRASRAIEQLSGIDQARATALRERVDRTRRSSIEQRLAKSLAAIEVAADPAMAIAAARADVEAARAIDAELATRSEANLEATRERVTARVLAEGQAAAARGDLRVAVARFGVATAIASDPRAVDKARARALDTAVRQQHAIARDLARADKLTEAIALADSILASIPAARSVAADRARWSATLERREQKREVEAQRRDEAARKKAEQEAQRAARADELARQKAEQEAQRAARAEAARREKEVQARKEEEARQQAAAAKLRAQIERANAAKTSTVQFELPPRYAGRELLDRVPVPSTCSATPKRVLARPCETCPPRAMSRVEMVCGPMTFTFVHDQRSIWLTCSSATNACGDCLSAGQSALTATLNAGDKLQVVKGCPRR